jgi:N-methylhydantoinase A
LKNWLIGIDVGGTFNDGVLIRPHAEPLAVKTPTIVEDSVASLLGCLDAMAEQAGVGRHELLARCAKFSYGTTQAANMVVEGNGAKTAFITTKGFRDTLVIAGIGRDRIGQDLVDSRGPSLVPRHLIFEVSERVDSAGRQITPLNEQDAKSAVAAMKAQGVESVGICLLWSFLNDEHEQRIAQYVRDETGWFVSVSSQCAPVLGEYERSATTALNARLGPPVRKHLLSVDSRLADEGLSVRPLVMTSAGGLLPLPDAAARPVSLLASGPAGGVLACRLLAGTMGIENVICADMGGTTFDVSLITDGEPSQSQRGVYAGQEIATAAIDIISVGAGGGSIAWVERGTRLKVGPQSAGARPGPACYGRGGTLPTVTDVNLLLGRLNPSGLASGSLALDPDAARAALGRLGAELSLSAEEAAAGVLQIVDAAMADAIHSQTVSRGLDPRGYSMFAFGGSGPLHAATIAAELGVRHIVVPQLGPVFSAYGIVVSDIQHVLTRSVPVAVEDHAAVTAAVRALEEKGSRDLDLDGVALELRQFIRLAQLRFRGQLHTVDVPLPGGLLDASALEQVSKDFIARYERLYGIGTSSPDAGIEIVTLTVQAVGVTDRPRTAEVHIGRSCAEPQGTRRAWTGTEFADVDRFVGPLRAGAVLSGPALIDLPGSTVWVPAGVEGHVDGLGSLNLVLPSA